MDCVTEVVVVVVVVGWGELSSWSVSNTRGSQAAVAGRLCCSDLMEISRRLLKCSEARSSYKDGIERYKRQTGESGQDNRQRG